MIDFKELIEQGIKCDNCKHCKIVHHYDDHEALCTLLDDLPIDEYEFFCSEFKPKDSK